MLVAVDKYGNNVTGQVKDLAPSGLRRKQAVGVQIEQVHRNLQTPPKRK